MGFYEKNKTKTQQKKFIYAYNILYFYTLLYLLYLPTHKSYYCIGCAQGCK